MKAFMEELAESVCILDKQDQIVFVNRALVKHLGYSVDAREREVVRGNIRFEGIGNIREIKAIDRNGEMRRGEILFCQNDYVENDYQYGIVSWKDAIDYHKKLNILVSFLDGCGEEIAIKDREGRYVFINKMYGERLGKSANEVVGKTDRDFWGRDECEGIWNNDDYVRRTKNRCVIEEEHPQKGDVAYYQKTKFPILDEEGEVAYVGTSMKNITVLKKMDHQVKDANLKLHHIEARTIVGAESYPGEGMVVKAQIRSILRDYFKTNFFNIWRYSETDEALRPYLEVKRVTMLAQKPIAKPIGKRQVEAYLKGEYNRINEITQLPFWEGVKPQLEASGIRYVVTYPIIYDGEFLGVIYVCEKEYPKEQLIRNSAIDTVCNQIGLIIKNENLCEKLQREFERRQGVEDQLKIFLDISVDLVVAVDRAGYYTKVNGECSKVLGWDEKQILQMNYLDLIHEEDIEQTRELARKCRISGEVELLVNRYRCMDGSYKWLSWNMQYVEKDQLILATAKDITYEILLREREKVAEKAIQLEVLKNEFFANLSHEFKTPLTMIMSAVQMISRHMVKENTERAECMEVVKHLGIIKQNSYRLLRLINNLIDVTKIDTGYYTLKCQNYNIVAVVEEIVMSVVCYAKDKAIEVTFDTETEDEVIACDPDKIERILLNLLSNAIKYTPEEGHVDVNILLEQEMVVIQVKDNGVGIPHHKIDFIFDRFMQVDDVLTRHCEGSGIGLSLVKSLVELHEGSIRAESQQGKGSVFEVRLPRQRVENEEEIQQMFTKDLQLRLQTCQIEFADIYNV
ncbi:MAG: ATP-binding protein [Cellulosilyticaceae bacterium]